jgi:type 1 fimbria pilin
MLLTGAAIAMAAMALPGAGQAADGKISFIGAVTTPSCALIVSDVDPSRMIDSISNAGAATLILPAAAGTSFSISAADCDGAVYATKMGTASVVSIYFESVNSLQRVSDGIISIVYK